MTSSPDADPAVLDGETAPQVTVFGPASLSNLGPGFDAIGLAIAGVGDTVEAVRTDAPGASIDAVDGDDGRVSLHAADNTAGVAAGAVLKAARADFGVRLRIRKGVPLGSGIGGSAASAVAGAWAAAQLLPEPPERAALVEAVLEGEAVASGSRHGDNVLPALFGGLVLVSASEPTRYRRVPLPRALPLAVLVPHVEVLTRAARAILPEHVTLRNAAHNAGALAFLVDAFRCGDWEEVGRGVMSDRLVEPHRAALVPCYEAVREAAREAGAFGCALTGSGPAMFAVAGSASAAAEVLAAMEAAAAAEGISSSGLVTEADTEGVRVVR